jgi:hypothetical protein
MYGSNYGVPPQFDFTQSQMGSLPTTLDQINPSYYSQIAAFLAAKGGRLASVCGVCLYDTLRVDAGVLPSRDFVFFQNAIGQQQGLFVAGTQYTKNEIDVSRWITSGGQLSKGYEALIWSIGVQFHIPGSLDNSVQTAGNFINLPLDPGTATTAVAADAILMGNLMRAFQESLYFKLFVNQTDFEDGPGWRFPSGPYGASGFAAQSAAATAPAFTVQDGTINNGFGYSFQMPVMRHIPELTKFGVKMSVQNPFTTLLAGPVRVVVTLEGIGIQPITG